MSDTTRVARKFERCMPGSIRAAIYGQNVPSSTCPKVQGLCAGKDDSSSPVSRAANA